MYSHSYGPVSFTLARSAGTADEWSSIMRVVTACLPFCPNSGHSSLTGASRSSLPRLASMWAHSAVAPLVQEKMMLSVSFFHAALVLLSATQPDMQRHHGALREANQPGLFFVEPVLRQGVIEEALDEGRGGAHAGCRDSGIEARDAEPLIAEGIALARVGRVRRMEDGVGHQRRQHRGEPDQVVAVGAVAVQQHDQMARLAAGVGALTRAVELFHFFLFLLSPDRGRGWVRGLRSLVQPPLLASPPSGGEEY